MTRIADGFLVDSIADAALFKATNTDACSVFDPFNQLTKHGCSLLALVGVFSGQGWEKLVLNIGFPIFGGGIGSGAVPMSKVVNGITGHYRKRLTRRVAPTVFSFLTS